MPVEVRPSTGSLSVSIQRDGTISLSSGLCNRIHYNAGDSVVLFYIAKGPLVLLIKKIEYPNNAFFLSYLNKTPNGKSGGKFRSKPFYDEVLKPRVRLPKIRLQLIIPTDWTYDLGVFVDDISWLHTEFSRNGLDSVDKSRTAVYRLLDSRNRILRIGEGNLSERFGRFLKDPLLIKEVKFLEWIYIPEKADAQIIERLLIEKYIERSGTLPPLNVRRS